MSKFLTEHDWIWIIIGVAIDLFAGFALDQLTDLKLGEIILIIFVADILVLQMRHHHAFTARATAAERAKARLFYRREDTLKMAESIQIRAPGFISAMWTQMPLESTLKDYFNRSLRDASSKGIHTTRLIDIGRIPLDEIIEHIDDAWSYLESGFYKIVFVSDAPFEMIITDKGEGIFFQSQREGPVTLAITVPEDEFVSKLTEMFKAVIVAGSKEFKISEFPQCDHSKIRAYLEHVKQQIVG